MPFAMKPPNRNVQRPPHGTGPSIIYGNLMQQHQQRAQSPMPGPMPGPIDSKTIFSGAVNPEDPFSKEVNNLVALMSQIQFVLRKFGDKLSDDDKLELAQYYKQQINTHATNAFAAELMGQKAVTPQVNVPQPGMPRVR